MTDQFSMGTSNTNFMPFLGKVFDKAVDAGAEIGVAAYNNHNAKRAAERQVDAQKDLMALQYQYNKMAYKYQMTEGPGLYRQGLTSAGYNPILPFVGGSGLSNASFGASSLGSAAPENPALLDMNAINQARLVRLQQNQIKSQIENTNANTALQNEQTVNERLHQDLNILERTRRTIENLYLPSKLKAEIKEKLANSFALVANAFSNRMSAGASVISAEASMKHADFYGQDVLNKFQLGSDELSNDMEKFFVNKNFEAVKGVVNLALILYGAGKAKPLVDNLIKKYGASEVKNAIGDQMYMQIMKGL